MEEFLYTKGIQPTAAHSGGRCSDLTQEEVQHLWRYNLFPRDICSVTDTLSTPTITESPSVECQDLFISHRSISHAMHASWEQECQDLGFLVSSEGQGLHKMLPLRGFKPGTSHMLGKHCTTRVHLPLNNPLTLSEPALDRIHNLSYQHLCAFKSYFLIH